MLELIARGSILYFAILVLLRLLRRRVGGNVATMRLVFVLLIGESAARALGHYSSVLDTLIVIATLVGWNVVLNRLSHRVSFIERLVSSPRLQGRPRIRARRY